MDVIVHVGDILDVPADVMVCSANPWLNLSGGVGGAVLARIGDSIQAELHQYLKESGTSSVPAGTVVRTSAGGLPVRSLIHAVAIDPFYDSSIELVRSTLSACFEMAASLSAHTITVPALATGYGPLTIEAFSEAIAPLLAMNWPPLTTMIFVTRSDDLAAVFKTIALKDHH